MGHHHHLRKTPRSQTLPSSPTHSSSSSDFEFTISVSPRKSSATNLCPADDLFYKGQLLPLHLSPRISMVRTLLLSSSSTSSSTTTTTTTTARHSADSQTSFSTDGCDSSRPSSVTDEDLHLQTKLLFPSNNNQQKKPNNNYFSLSRFSSVFRKEIKPKPTSTSTTTTSTNTNTNVNPSTSTRVDPDIVTTGSSVKRMSVTAKEMFRKYLKKAKPLYEKLSQRQKMVPTRGVSDRVAENYETALPSTMSNRSGMKNSVENTRNNENDVVISHSFSGNLRYPRRRSCVSSCPSSMRSSPSHSGILCKNTVVKGSSNSSSMEELQSAIQGAIAHCKNSMTQNN